MKEVKQEILDLLILNGRAPQTIKSDERVVYLYDALNIVNKEFSKIEQPQLNENQQIVIDLEMSNYSVEVTDWSYPEELDTENLRYLFSTVLENARELEQEEE